MDSSVARSPNPDPSHSPKHNPKHCRRSSLNPKHCSRSSLNRKHCSRSSLNPNHRCRRLRPERAPRERLHCHQVRQASRHPLWNPAA